MPLMKLEANEIGDFGQQSNMSRIRWNRSRKFGIISLLAITVCSIYFVARRTSPIDVKFEKHDVSELNLSTAVAARKERLGFKSETLIDIDDFAYTILNDICPAGQQVHTVFVVHSAPKHVGFRNVLRKAFVLAGEDLGLTLKIAFMLATVRERDVSIAIQEESEEYKDIVQGNFIDAYRNLTYKHVMGLKWASGYCRQAKFVAKMDDDVFIDIHKFTYLQSRTLVDGNSILCNVFQNVKPQRAAEATKWNVSLQEYPSAEYPPYCSGWIEVMTQSLASKIVSVSERLPPFWIDDVYVTGMILKELGNIKYHNIGKLVNYEIQREVDSLEEAPYKHYDLSYIATSVGFYKNPFVSLLSALYAKSRWCFKHKCPPLPVIYSYLER